MVEISSVKGLENWLKDKPREGAIVLAHRAAMRVVPILNLGLVKADLSDEQFHRLLLISLRASLISEAAVISLTPQCRDAAYATVMAYNIAGHEKRAKNAFDSAVHSVINGLYVVNAGNVTKVAHETNNSGYLAAHASGAGRAYDTAMHQDQDWLLNHVRKRNGETELLSQPLWHGQKNPLEDNWEKLKQALLARDPNWKFWLDWYQARLDGTPHKGLTEKQQNDLYYKIATFPAEQWEEGVNWTERAKAVNQRIADLLEEVKGKGDGIKEAINLSPTSLSKGDIERIEQNKSAITLGCANLILQIQEQKEKLRGDNQLSVENPELKEELLSTFENLENAAENIGNSVAEVSDKITEKEADEIASYFDQLRDACRNQLELYISPENIAQGFVPLGIIFSCAAIGGLIAGPVGFGAGCYFGNLVTNNLKPKDLINEYRKSFDEDGQKD